VTRLRSLRARLLWTVSIATFLVWSVAGLVSYEKALHEADELMDGQLAQSAKLLMAQVLHEEEDLMETQEISETLDENASHPYEQHIEFRIWSHTGRLLLRSSNAPETITSPAPKDAPPRFEDMLHAGQPWRMLSMHSPDGRYLVQVAHPTKDRERVGLEVATQVGIPILLALPLLGLLVYFSVRRSLRPLEKLAAEVASRSPDNLEILPESHAPKETLPLLAALNRLLTRLRLTLDNERRFTADAAHELRTPLAAVKIQAQVALASTDPIDHQHALRQVLAGADRATLLVEQLLRLARLDPLASLPNRHTLDLADLTINVAESLRPTVEARQQQLAIAVQTRPIEVSGDADLLGVALRNLLENALRYTPAQGVIEIGAGIENGQPTLWVRDSGPGVEPTELPRLAERFFRGQNLNPDAPSAEGSGLGLAIVQRIAELHGARLELCNLAQGGLEARLRWP
jgi:two-component system sensor histidine kinase QseC